MSGPVATYYGLCVLWELVPLALGSLLFRHRRAWKALLLLGLGGLALTLPLGWRTSHYFSTVAIEPPAWRTAVGLGWSSLTSMLHVVWPDSDLPAFVASRFFGALAGPLSYLALLRLAGDPRLAILASAVLVALPFQIALAAGDDAHVSALALFLAGFCHWHDWVKEGARWSLAQAALCFLLMVHTRLETGLYLLAVIALTADGALWPRLRRDAPLLATMILAAAGSLAAAFEIPKGSWPSPSAEMIVREAVRAVLWFPSMGTLEHVRATLFGQVSADELRAIHFYDLSWVPWVLLPFTWLGWLIVVQSALGWRLAAAIVVLGLPGYVVMGAKANDYLAGRHYVGALPLLCLVAAHGVLAIARSLGRASIPLFAAAGALFVAQGLVPLRFQFTFQEEYAFLREALAHLPRKARLVAVSSKLDFGLEPVYSSLRLLRPDIRWVDVGWEPLPTDGRLFAYLGPDCVVMEEVSLEQASSKYKDPSARMRALARARETCRKVRSMKVRRVLAETQVSRRGRGAPVDPRGPPVPIALVELEWPPPWRPGEEAFTPPVH